jgi:hypothetical protein
VKGKIKELKNEKLFPKARNEPKLSLEQNSIFIQHKTTQKKVFDKLSQ